MKRKFYSLAVALAVAAFLAPASAADDPTASIIKQDSHTVSLELKFSKKKLNSLEHVISFLDWGPNGFATGFLVGDGLVMTSYHVVSGDLSASKKAQMGFAPNDRLEVKVNINGCQAAVIKVDEDADLALLRICRSQKQTKAPAFQTILNKDERLVLIARPHGDKRVRRGVYYGPYPFRGLQYSSASLDVRDGFSGSPVYNDRAEIVGVFSGYDWAKKLALISPGDRAQKLLDDYVSNAKP
ncbi:MAG TPA: serine protease [Pyrinomonadaceae bacterium]|nr:serine protease [Pyrinomonadaceae bacterium]